MTDEIHIVSAIIHATPESMEFALEQARCLGARIHVTSPDGRVVITLEGDQRSAVMNSLDALRAVSGVIAVSLVYHQSEPLSDLEEPAV